MEIVFLNDGGRLLTLPKIRGGPDFAGSLDACLYPAAGCPNDAGEFNVSLDTAIVELRKISAESEGDPASMEEFFAEVADELCKNADLRKRAGITRNKPTVGDVRRFLLNNADKDSKRVLTTVYRCKGDEADTVIVDDTASFNESWNNDADEAAACRHVAMSRARESLLVVGPLAGATLPLPCDESADVADWTVDSAEVDSREETADQERAIASNPTADMDGDLTPF